MEKIKNIAGDDEAQRLADAKGYKTTIENVTGGTTKDLDTMTGPEVGAPYGKNILDKAGAK